MDSGHGERDLAVTSHGPLRRSCHPAIGGVGFPAVVPGERRRRAPARLSCVSRGGGAFANEGHLRYYHVAPRKAVARALSKLQDMGLFAGDAAKERISEATELLLQELSQLNYAKDELKKKHQEELMFTGMNKRPRSAES